MQQIPERTKPPVVNYKPRTSNASMDAIKKLREQSACKDATINTLTKQLEEVQKEKAAMEWFQAEATREVMKPKEESKEEDNGYQMLRPARLPVRPIYVIVKKKYIDIDELAEFVVQDYCNGRAESMGQCADQTDMTPNREKKGRAFVTSKPGAEHPIIDKYLKWMQSKFKPFMHVREAGEFGAGFSVGITG